MDEETIEKVKKLIYQTAEENGIEIKELIIFGSRAKDDYRPRSDIDLLIVSPDFEGVAWNKRPRAFYKVWDYEELPEPEFICLTPEQYEKQRSMEAHIVKNAVEEGVKV